MPRGEDGVGSDQRDADALARDAAEAEQGLQSGDAAAGTAATAKAGWLFQKGALDFAGGTVVHINAAVAGLVGAFMFGKRIGFGREAIRPHSLTFTMVGASLLWFGWFGFNAGSALEANGSAALAFVNTLLATCAAVLSWTFGEWIGKGKPSMLGGASGAVAGLVAITPAAGFAGPMGSFEPFTALSKLVLIAEMYLGRLEIVQAIAATQPSESWMASDNGLAPIDVAMSVAIPEFDGRIVTVPFSFKEQGPDDVPVYVADPERAARVAGIAVRHARLKHKANADKKLALVFTAYPTKHSRVGNAVGLDTPASAVRVLDALKDAGYALTELASNRGLVVQAPRGQLSFQVRVAGRDAQVWFIRQR